MPGPHPRTVERETQTLLADPQGHLRLGALGLAGGREPGHGALAPLVGQQIQGREPGDQDQQSASDQRFLAPGGEDRGPVAADPHHERLVRPARLRPNGAQGDETRRAGHGGGPAQDAVVLIAFEIVADLRIGRCTGPA